MTEPEFVGVAGLPVGEVLAGLRIPALPEGSIANGMMAMVKLDEPDGEQGWSVRVTAGLNDDELLGVLTSYVAHLTREASESWDEGDPTRAD